MIRKLSFLTLSFLTLFLVTATPNSNKRPLTSKDIINSQRAAFEILDNSLIISLEQFPEIRDTKLKLSVYVSSGKSFLPLDLAVEIINKIKASSLNEINFNGN